MLERIFKLKENNTNVKTEIIAGVTTFMTMAYILAVNPSILSDSGMDSTAVLIATCLASVIGTWCMALFANLPFALSAGLGLNAYFAYTVVDNMGYSWQIALLAVFIEGVIFIILSLTNVREAIFNAIPMTLKKAVSVGIGLFIAFIGLQKSGLSVKNDDTLVSIIDFTADFNGAGICALLTVIGLIITAVLYIKKVKGSILIGIIITWVLGIIAELTGLYVPNPEAELYSVIPTGIVSFDLSALGKTAGQFLNVDWGSIKILDMIVVVFAFLFVDLFDTLGTLIGVSSKAKMLDEEGKLPKGKEALLADAVATTAGAALGTSTVTTFVESASGVAEGGRTGLTSMVTGALFLVSVVFAPVFTTIPSFATAPALLMVGYLMVSSVIEIKMTDDNLLEAIPAYLCIIAMPLFYSISEGISIGIISYTLLHLLTGKGKKVQPLMYILSILFILKYIFL